MLVKQRGHSYVVVNLTSAPQVLEEGKVLNRGHHLEPKTKNQKPKTQAGYKSEKGEGVKYLTHTRWYEHKPNDRSGKKERKLDVNKEHTAVPSTCGPCEATGGNSTASWAACLPP